MAREVAMNRNWKYGNVRCSSCNTVGDWKPMEQGRCSKCHRPTCAACRAGGAGADRGGVCFRCAPSRPRSMSVREAREAGIEIAEACPEGCQCALCRAYELAERERREIAPHRDACPCEACGMRRHWTRPLSDEELGAS